MIERTVDGLHAHLYSLLKALIGAGQHLSILDIGCGTGAWLNRVKDLGFSRIVGIDYVQPILIAELELRQFDINYDRPAALGQFDIVTCIEVIEHIENVGNLLDVMQQTLSQNGLAIITTPNIESLRARLRAALTGKIPSFDNKSDPTHLCPILYDSLKKMLGRRGMTISSVHQYPSARSKSLMFSSSINWLSNTLRAFLPDDLHGDNIVYVIRRL